MPDQAAGVVSIAFQYLDRFLNDYGIWLWLLVFSLGVFIASSLGYLDLDGAQRGDLSTLVVLACWFTFCILMNAVKGHVFVAGAVAAVFMAPVLYAFVTIDSVRTKAKAKKNFDKIIQVECQERDWLVWFMFNEEKRHFGSITISKSKDDYRYGNWDNMPMYYLSYFCNIFAVDGKRDMFHINNIEFALAKVGDRVTVRPAFDIYSRLQKLADKVPTLREQIRAVRAEVLDVAPSELLQRKNKPMLTFDLKRKADDRAAF